ncbi:uncharacterized protein LOC129599510 isoform X2 [Paramacrobiotus metropolitanus]|uniref:uncharacterized protein LOC129599510 isoform X2 n=1 Tax=Paramacrobiotus metropolitanus TaxID=2943436 RepID=UPI0024457FC4|nr:uncharacterized protein LOC129599510 isoform X2 [Paramacrobiotus metropolitanus]
MATYFQRNRYYKNSAVTALRMIFMLSTVLPAVTCLRCYSCDGCDDPFYPALDYIQDCNVDAALDAVQTQNNAAMTDLRSTALSRFGKDRGQLQQQNDAQRTPVCVKVSSVDGTIQRGCGTKNIAITGCQFLQTQKSFVCSCSQDLCNSGDHCQFRLNSITLWLFIGLLICMHRFA